ncbi:MAG: hypothetical protein VR64_03310 [Desulfatitalea sp. BRH_c12]|nr:MAG: hypothetical protein VR64_03310 [Desulfatitalea sp. BRH_c12]
MLFSTSKNNTNRLARAAIWSIQYQDQIANYFRIFVGAAAGLVLFAGMIGVVPLKAALLSILVGGVIVIGGAGYLIQKRRVWLLNIKDPELKRLAYASMLAYITLKGRCLQQEGSEKEWVCKPFRSHAKAK